MPCGGITPTTIGLEGIGLQKRCFFCGEPPQDVTTKAYFCDEWDAWIHRECIHQFLQTDAGRVVLAHKHEIHINDEAS